MHQEAVGALVWVMPEVVVALVWVVPTHVTLSSSVLPQGPAAASVDALSDLDSVGSWRPRLPL